MELKEIEKKYSPPDQKERIDDFDQKHRETLEKGINLLRYGMDEHEIKEFFTVVRVDPELTEYINTHMNIWGPGFEYE